MCLDNPSAAQKEEFQFEIEQMKQLGSHPNVVSLVGCCTLQDEKFLVIEYVPFGDLLTWLRCRRNRVRKWKISTMNFELRLLKKKRERVRLLRNEKEHSRFSPFSIAKKVFSRCFPLISPSSHPSTAPASRPFLLRSPYPACPLFSWVRPTLVLLNF